MPLKVLISPDKFKGTLTAAAAAQAMAEGWARVRPADELVLLPMSDGGDGFGEIISQLLGAAPQMVRTVDAAHRPCSAPWWWHEFTRTAIVESARVVGLAQLPPGKYHPFELDTEGLGEVLRTARQHGAHTCLVGIGGSATNDAGFGLGQALGWKFFNTRDEKIMRWTELHNLAQVRPPDHTRLFPELIVAVDVQNTLLGPQGCTHVYGPQKGLRPEDFEFAERCLDQLQTIVEKELHLACASEPGSGAAGGLGYGLRCFAEARLEPGFGLFARYARLADRVRAANLVLTGEGALDASSLMGKGVGELAALCQSYQVPCIAVAGAVPNRAEAGARFARTYALAPDLFTTETALAEPVRCLQEAAARAAKERSRR